MPSTEQTAGLADSKIAASACRCLLTTHHWQSGADLLLELPSNVACRVVEAHDEAAQAAAALRKPAAQLLAGLQGAGGAAAGAAEANMCM